MTRPYYKCNRSPWERKRHQNPTKTSRRFHQEEWSVFHITRSTATFQLVLDSSFCCIPADGHSVWPCGDGVCGPFGPRFRGWAR